MYLSLLCFTQLTMNLSRDDDAVNRQYEMMKRIGNPKSSIIHQLFFLFLIYIEYPLMMFLVTAGLYVMDIYHVTMLLIFVVYTTCPKFVKKWTIVILIYADFFVLEKYIYTLSVNDAEKFENPKSWVLLFGFNADAYNPDVERQYFRYAPTLD